MIFTEPRFLFFFAAVFAVYWLIDSRRNQKLWLLATSYVFYGAWDYRFLALIAISTWVDYVVGVKLDSENDPRRRQIWVTLSVVTNLTMLGFFKYYGFFIDSTEDFMNLLGLGFSRPTLEVVLPVGISFFTFQTMSYSIDVYRRKLQPSHSLLDVSLFVAFFPQLVAGPIVRASAFLPQLKEAPVFSTIRFRPHLALFLAGFIKKACVGDNLALAVDPYFADPTAFGVAATWLAVVLYSVQLYCDFSGYTDMAIASAGLLGFDLGINFNAPYLSPTITEFWQRWHISLSTWLRDYLYIPLGGNRQGRRRTEINIFLTMVLGGLWHGAAWKFVVWGALHGILLFTHRKLIARSSGVPFTQRSRIHASIGIAFVFLMGCATRIPFRSNDLADSLVIFKSYVFLQPAGTQTLDPHWWLVFIGLATSHIIANRHPAAWEKLGPHSFALAYGALVAIALLFVRIDTQPFIYFQF